MKLFCLATEQSTSLMKKFEANNFLQKAFFYFPNEDTYLSPDAAFLRVGFIPWEIYGNPWSVC